MIVTLLKVELLSDKSIPTPNPSLILTANHDLLKVRKGGGGGEVKKRQNTTGPGLCFTFRMQRLYRIQVR